MKLNNKGQTLILFVVLIPVLLMVLAIVVDVSLMYHEKIKSENTTKTIIKNVYGNRSDDNIKNQIKDLFKKNNIEYKNIKISSTSEYIKITNNYEIDSIFGKIIGFKKYKIKINIKGYMKNNKIIFTKE